MSNSATLSNVLTLAAGGDSDLAKQYQRKTDKQHILDTFHSLQNKADVVIITGGLGPTKDDITKKNSVKTCSESL